MMIPVAKPLIGEEEIKEVEKVLKSDLWRKARKWLNLKKLCKLCWC